MTYSNHDIERVKRSADIRDFIPGLETIGRRTYAKCPNCGKEHKEGMLVTHNSRMDLAKCFSCGEKIVGAINAAMVFRNLRFPEAVKVVADEYGIPIESEEEKKERQKQSSKSKAKGSFCLQQLRASGLTIEDVTAKVIDAKGNVSWVPTFQKGSMSMRTGTIDQNGDEMLIYYYDLAGMQMKCQSPASKSTLIPYVRIRWSNPDLKAGEDGRAIKYQSLKGSETRFYFPQKIRTAYAEAANIDTLFIQEGEKKAEKACKHGIWSIGIQGIYNIGNKDSGLIQDLQYLVKKCSVKNIVLLFDSDWDNLSKSLSNGDDIDQRPNQFAKATIKFNTYIGTLHNVGASVNVWFGHINHSESGEKGIDDLLCGSLKGKEETLAGEIAEVMHSHNGKGIHIDIHKISALTDFQIMDFWNLRDRDAFFQRYAEQISALSYFKFGKINYRKNEDGQFIKASAQGGDKEFWYAYTNDKDKKIIEFDTLNAISFLEANGFIRIYSEEKNKAEYEFVKIEDGVIRSTAPHWLRDFAYRYALQNCKDRAVLNYIADKLGSLLGTDRLERLKIIEDNFERADPEVQNLHYKNCQVRITPNSIDTGPRMEMVWENRLIGRKFKRVPIFDRVEKISDGYFDIRISEEGQKCEFLQFIANTSNYWKNEQQLSEERQREMEANMINKMTAIGYLCCDYKYESEKTAVVAMDAKISAVGTSNGRTGKSMIGAAISKILCQTVIDGKTLSNDDDYMYSGVTFRTRNILLDDIKVNFDFQRLFQAICGSLEVNPKMGARFSVPFEKAPKFLITTNHAINDNSDSTKDRIAYISFSDWYGADYKPITDFGHEFFSDWDETQWNLFDNFMAECIMLYFRSRVCGWVAPGKGIVPPSMHNLEARQMRQRMGEAFLQWAEAAFSPEGSFLNQRTDRKVLYTNFCEEFPGQRQFVSSSGFSDKIKTFCKYRGLHFNPHKTNKDGLSFKEWMSLHPEDPFIGSRDLANSKDYFSICTEQHAKLSII